MKRHFVYIITNQSGRLYTGVTNNLERRVLEYKRKLSPRLTSKNNLNRLAYYEQFRDVRAAIHREKQIKGWLREKKIALVESMNPEWEDLSAGWYGKQKGRDSSLRSK